MFFVTSIKILRCLKKSASIQLLYTVDLEISLENHCRFCKSFNYAQSGERQLQYFMGDARQI